MSNGRQVRCNECGYVGDESEFPKGRDFFQNTYIRLCAKQCGNMQSPGGASLRMMDDKRPFVYIRPVQIEAMDALGTTSRRADEAS